MLAGQVTPFVDSPVIDPLTEVTGKSLHKFRLAAVKLNDSGLIFDIGKYLFGYGWCDTASKADCCRFCLQTLKA